MIQEMISQGILFYVIAGVCAIGILSSLISGILYGRLLHDAKNMASPKGKLMMQMKNRYENNFRLRESVNNVSVFVDKHLSQYKFLGISLHRLKALSIYAMGFSVLLSGAAVYLSWYYELTRQIMLNYASAGAAALLLLIAVQGLADTAYKHQEILTYVRDYLENTLLNRLRTDITNVEKTRDNFVKPVVTPYAQESEAVTVTAAMEPVTVREAAARSELKSDYAKPESTTRQAKAVKTAGREKEAPASPSIAAPAASEARISKEKSSVKERLSRREIKDNVDKMKESMNQIAAGNAEQRKQNREILKQMDAKQQEEVIREILKEYLS